MPAARASFEIQALRNGNWIIEDQCDTELTARNAAKSLFGKGGCLGVRVLRNWARADGVTTANIIHTELRDPDPARLRIVAIDEAPFCRKPVEFYRLASRSTINRVLRNYLDQVFLTPTELIHNYKALKKVQAVDSLFAPAVDRVATIQARQVNIDSKLRSEEIYRTVQRLTDRARKADDHPGLPRLTGNDLAGLIDQVARMAPDGETDFYTLVALSQDLVERRDWLGKLDRLVSLLHPDHKEGTLALLDGIIADIVAVPAALQDILGYQRNLAEALGAIIDLHDGRAPEQSSDAADQIRTIAPLLVAGRLEQTRKSLVDRVIRQLNSGQPLSRNEPTQEREAFRQLMQKLARPEGLVGGPEMAAALTRRFVFLLEQGGKTGLQLAVSGVTAKVGDSLFSVLYLTNLAASPLADSLSSEIMLLLTALADSPLEKLAPKAWPFKERLLRVTRIYETIGQAGSLPAEQRAMLQQKLDNSLSAYIKSSGIIEKLDDPKAHLRDRATRLIEFCAAKLLPLGSQSFKAAQERVIALLRQPNFDEFLLEGLTDPRAREERLRSFHSLLLRSGFK